MQHMAMTKFLSVEISQVNVYIFLMQLPAKQSYLQLAKKHSFSTSLTIFKFSNSSLLILTYSFGMNQLIKGKNKLIQVLIISTIKYLVIIFNNSIFWVFIDDFRFA